MPATSRPGGASTFTVSTPGDRQIEVERVFEASRDRVWQAYTDPALVARWWGRGNRLVVEEMSVRPGGRWRYVEHAADGVHAFGGQYQQVVPIQLITRTFSWDGAPESVHVETVALEAVSLERTKVTVTADFGTSDERDRMLASGMTGGLEHSYLVLDEVLQSI
jgi:uncharacterized protein YndB with AHSA1/START domain